MSTRALESGGRFVPLCVGLPVGGERARATAPLSRRSDQVSSSSVRQGVRQDNWSDGRFRCRWLRFLGRDRDVSRSGRQIQDSQP